MARSNAFDDLAARGLPALADSWAALALLAGAGTLALALCMALPRFGEHAWETVHPERWGALGLSLCASCLVGVVLLAGWAFVSGEPADAVLFGARGLVAWPCLVGLRTVLFLRSLGPAPGRREETLFVVAPALVASLARAGLGAGGAVGYARWRTRPAAARGRRAGRTNRRAPSSATRTGWCRAPCRGGAPTRRSTRRPRCPDAVLRIRGRAGATGGPRRVRLVGVRLFAGPGLRLLPGRVRRRGRPGVHAGGGRRRRPSLTRARRSRLRLRGAPAALPRAGGA
jgi:hypothetical protein